MKVGEIHHSFSTIPSLGKYSEYVYDVIAENGTKIYFKDVWKVTEKAEFYSGFSYRGFSAFLPLIIAANIAVLVIGKGRLVEDFREKAGFADKACYAFNCVLTPTKYENWRDQTRRRRSNDEGSFFDLAVFTGVNLTLTFPLWILKSSIES